MKLTKTASGKTTIKMSRSEWTEMGKKAGWMKEAEENNYYMPDPSSNVHNDIDEVITNSVKGLTEIHKSLVGQAMTGGDSRTLDYLMRELVDIEHKVLKLKSDLLGS